MMSLQEELQMRQKVQADRAEMPMETRAAKGSMSGYQNIVDRPFNEEAHGFISLLSKLITRARWGVTTDTVVVILRRAVADLEEELRDASE